MLYNELKNEILGNNNDYELLKQFDHLYLLACEGKLKMKKINK
jgi:hypothetical protein